LPSLFNLDIVLTRPPGIILLEIYNMDELKEYFLTITHEKYGILIG